MDGHLPRGAVDRAAAVDTDGSHPGRVGDLPDLAGLVLVSRLAPGAQRPVVLVAVVGPVLGQDDIALPVQGGLQEAPEHGLDKRIPPVIGLPAQEVVREPAQALPGEHVVGPRRGRVPLG